MKKYLALTLFVMTACSSSSTKPPVSTTSSQQPQADKTPAADDNNLNDLDSITFACPKAALNAAAREAKKAPTLGTYQFSYFSIINNSHHAQYEVHFTSNVYEEPVLKYCVSIYCQQGWDPKTAKTMIELIDDKKHPAGKSKKPGHEPNCSHKMPKTSQQQKKT
jgi:hypothetical protein